MNTMTYQLFWAPGTAAIAPHALLEEIGAPFGLVRVDLAAGEHRRPEYLKLNPNGRVPVLVVDGVPMFETAAICQLLTERHPDALLAPPPGAPERARFLQWLTWQTNTLQETFLQWFHPDWRVAGEAARAALKADAEARLDAHWKLLDDALAARGPYLCGDAFSAVDVYLAMLLRWSRFCATPGWHRPHVKRCADLVVARPAWGRMMAAQGIQWPY